MQTKCSYNLGSRRFGKIASRQLKIYDSQWSLGTCNLIAIRIQLESVYCGGLEWINSQLFQNALIPHLVTIISGLISRRVSSGLSLHFHLRANASYLQTLREEASGASERALTRLSLPKTLGLALFYLLLCREGLNPVKSCLKVTVKVMLSIYKSLGM